MHNYNLVSSQISFEENCEGLLIKQSQDIPDDYLSELRNERAESLHTPTGEFHRVASIPMLLVNKWKAEGFDIYREPIEAIIARLKKEALDGFITSNKV